MLIERRRERRPPFSLITIGVCSASNSSVFLADHDRVLSSPRFLIVSFSALGSVGVDPEKATAAALAVGEYECRLRRIERMIETARSGALLLAAQGVAFVLLILVVIRSFSLG